MDADPRDYTFIPPATVQECSICHTFFVQTLEHALENPTEPTVCLDCEKKPPRGGEDMSTLNNLLRRIQATAPQSEPPKQSNWLLALLLIIVVAWFCIICVVERHKALVPPDIQRKAP